MTLMHVASFGAPPVSSFDPTTVAGCALYLRSDLGVTLSGSTVTAWADQSGNGRNATPVGSPTRVASVQNGFPSVHFNGANQYFTLASSATGGANWTLFAVAKPATVGSENAIYCESQATGSNYRLAEFNTTWAMSVQSGSSAQANDPTTIVASTPYVLSGTSANGNPIVAYVNGDAGTSASNASITALTPARFTIGAYFLFGGYSAYFPGDLMALIVYNSVLSSTDRAYVRDGLKTLYAAY